MSSQRHYTTKQNQPPGRGVPPGVTYTYVSTGRYAPPPPPQERHHFATTSGQPPSRSVPPGVGFTSQPLRSALTPPATPISAGPPPPASASQPKIVRFDLGNGPPVSPLSPSPSTHHLHYEPPGIHLGGSSPPFVHDGAAYIFPKDHVRIHFFHQGHRPFDLPTGAQPSFQAFVVPSNTSLTELMYRFGIPEHEGIRYGITECIEAGQGRWEKGSTWMMGGTGSGAIKVAEFGKGVTWLASFDRAKHGPP